MEFLNYKILDANAKEPKRATAGSAGYDLFACNEEPITIWPKKSEIIPIGIAIEILDKNIVAYIYSRSSLGVKHMVTMGNSVGVIDSDYRGEISVLLINQSDKAFIVNPHDRIAQMVFSPVFLPVLKEVKNLTDTKRGSGGFGSTGKNLELK